MEMATGFPGYNTLMPKSCARSPRCCGRTATAPPGSARTTTCPTGRPARPGRSTAGRPAWVSSTSTASSAARPASGQPAMYEEHQAHRAAARRQGLFFEQRHGRPGHRAGSACSTRSPPTSRGSIYYAPGTAHAPHHAPKEWIDKFKGQFDQGWDKMREDTLAQPEAAGRRARRTPSSTARPNGIPAWDSLDADQKKVYAQHDGNLRRRLGLRDHRWAASSTRSRRRANWTTRWSSTSRATTGQRRGRPPTALLNEMSVLQRGPEDFRRGHGADMDDIGGPTTYNHYPIGWAYAMDTPFQWAKQVASHFGGTRNGLVISWPPHQGEGRTAHAVPPHHRHCADHPRSGGVESPSMLNGVTQKPIEGVSMVYTFDDAKAPSTHARSISRCRQPRPLPRRLDRLHHGARCRRGPEQGASTSTTTSGSSTTSRRTSARRTTSRRRRPEKAARATGAVLDRGGQVQRAAARRPQRRADQCRLRPSLSAGRTEFTD